MKDILLSPVRIQFQNNSYYKIFVRIGLGRREMYVVAVISKVVWMRFRWWDEWSQDVVGIPDNLIEEASICSGHNFGKG